MSTSENNKANEKDSENGNKHPHTGSDTTINYTKWGYPCSYADSTDNHTHTFTSKLRYKYIHI